MVKDRARGTSPREKEVSCYTLVMKRGIWALVLAAAGVSGACNKPPNTPSGSGICNFDTDVSDLAVCKRECDEGKQTSCIALGMVSETRGGASVSEQALLDDCTDSFHPSCQGQGASSQNKPKSGTAASNSTAPTSKGPDPAVAAETFRRACDGASDGVACFELGRMTQVGLGVRQDSEQATKYFAKACRLGIAAACTEGDGAGRRR